MVKKIDIKVIPHSKQKYITLGNYTTHVKRSNTNVARQTSLASHVDSHKDAIAEVDISDTGNEIYNYLLMIHELTEYHLIRRDNVDEAACTAFDIAFEKTNKDNKEPGEQVGCPYFYQHEKALKAEKYIAKLLGVNWKDYEKALEKVLIDKK